MMKLALFVLAALAVAHAQYIAPYVASPALYGSAYYSTGYAYPYAYNAYSAPLTYAASPLTYSTYLYR